MLASPDCYILSLSLAILYFLSVSLAIYWQYPKLWIGNIPSFILAVSLTILAVSLDTYCWHTYLCTYRTVSPDFYRFYPQLNIGSISGYILAVSLDIYWQYPWIYIGVSLDIHWQYTWIYNGNIHPYPSYCIAASSVCLSCVPGWLQFKFNNWPVSARDSDSIFFPLTIWNSPQPKRGVSLKPPPPPL
jgi:hypothetical protein